MRLLTRIGVEPHPSTASRTGRLRYGPVFLGLTGRRMSASPCWPSPVHPGGEGRGDRGRKRERQNRENTIAGSR